MKDYGSIPIAIDALLKSINGDMQIDGKGLPGINSPPSIKYRRRHWATDDFKKKKRITIAEKADEE